MAGKVAASFCSVMVSSSKNAGLAMRGCVPTAKLKASTSVSRCQGRAAVITERGRGVSRLAQGSVRPPRRGLERVCQRLRGLKNGRQRGGQIANRLLREVDVIVAEA
eukprot:scaffold42399_cov33-Prasinocladus_malaysianus.AAC.1